MLGDRISSWNRSSAWEFGPDSVWADELVTYRQQGLAFYSDDQRLVAYQLNRDSIKLTTPMDTASWGGYEEYWYDALGRRSDSRSDNGDEGATAAAWLR